MNLITQALAAVRADQPIPALPGHVFEVCLEKQDDHWQASWIVTPEIAEIKG